MIFDPVNIRRKAGQFRFVGAVEAEGASCLQGEIFREFWGNFSFCQSSLLLSETSETVFRIGGVPAIPCDEGCTCTINVEPEGVCICAATEKDLIRGWMTLLDRIRAEENGEETVLAIDCCEIRETPLIERRMVHFCIFPETELWELRRFIRFCAALKYTHLVLEFWGMLRYDCLRELAWPGAYTKEQIRPLLREARELGLEIVPMFNHWGHASACRVMHGKHVVLDQNPALQTLFSEDGWCWNIRSLRVQELLRQIRTELMELCGEGAYFHIGCDEAYNFNLTRDDAMDAICGFVNGIAQEMKAQGRRIFMWGDMFLSRYPHYIPENRYVCNAPEPRCEPYMLERLSRDVIVADWQYWAKQAPVETCAVFTRAGFDCVICPWDQGMNEMTACLTTAGEQALFGLMHTTWHTLSQGMPYVTMAALGCFEEVGSRRFNWLRTQTAALLRKVDPAEGVYEKAGWAKRQIGVIT